MVSLRSGSCISHCAVRVRGAAMSSLFAAAAAALSANRRGPWIPPGWVDRFGADSVEPLLTTIAPGMPAVTTLSLDVRAPAFAGVTSGVTPRATRLPAEDTIAHDALATFLGSFLFNLVALIGLSAGRCEAQGRPILFPPRSWSSR